MDVMTENKLVPELSFAEFENERNTNSYKKHSFTDIFLFSSGKNIKQAEASPEFETPCVRYGELYHMYNEVIYKIINRTNLAKSELLFSQGNEILLPSAGEDPLDIGSASALTLKDVAIGRTINVLSPKSDNVYSQKYASYYINQKLRKQISKMARGVSISNVYNSDLKKLKIILPSLKEQQKIASFLSSVDKKLQQLAKKKELLSAYKKGVMQKIFSQELRFKDEFGNNYPDCVELHLFDFLIPEFRERDKPICNYLAIGIRSHCKGTFQKPNSDPLKIAMEKLFLVKENDLIVNITFAWEGAIALVKKEDEGGYVSHRFPTYLFIRSIVLYEFFKYIMVKKSFRHQLNLKSPGGAGRNRVLNKKEFLKIKVNIPSIEEQKKIADFLSSFDSKIELVKTQIENTKAFKKGLLQQMFV